MSPIQNIKAKIEKKKPNKQTTNQKKNPMILQTASTWLV